MDGDAAKEAEDPAMAKEITIITDKVFPDADIAMADIFADGSEGTARQQMGAGEAPLVSELEDCLPESRSTGPPVGESGASVDPLATAENETAFSGIQRKILEKVEPADINRGVGDAAVDEVPRASGEDTTPPAEVAVLEDADPTPDSTEADPGNPHKKQRTND
jgi:hypothetical protein